MEHTIRPRGVWFSNARAPLDRARSPELVRAYLESRLSSSPPAASARARRPTSHSRRLSHRCGSRGSTVLPPQGCCFYLDVRDRSLRRRHRAARASVLRGRTVPVVGAIAPFARNTTAVSIGEVKAQPGWHEQS
jgi:hypothetical protein